MDAFLIEKVLSHQENTAFHVHRVVRLTDALAFLSNEQVDVIILDLVLSDSQGIQTFRRIHARSESVPIVVFSMIDDEGTALEAVKLGAQDFLFKTDLRADLLIRSMNYAMERKRIQLRLSQTVSDLKQALNEVETLSGLLPICVTCSKIRDDHGYWSRVEQYIKVHSKAQFTHSLCPDCYVELYPEIYYKYQKNTDNE